MPLSNHDGLQSDDCGQSIERSARSESADKSSHRTSIFVEHHQDHHDLPPVWGKDSQPGYKGQRVLGLLPSLHPDGPYANSGPLGAYDPRYIESARTTRPRLSDMGYEMPERYGGKEVAYGEEGVIPLTSNNNTWAPPVAQEYRVCGVARWAFWAAFICICFFLVIGGAIGGVVASSKKSAASSNSNSSSPIATSSSSTSIGSSISTFTLSNGQVILITQVYTATQTNKFQTTVISRTTTGSFPASSTASSSYNATSNINPLSTTTTAASSTATSFSAGAYPLDCPSLNGTTVPATAGSTQYSYIIYCATDSPTADMNVVTATSMLECYNACAQYSGNLGTLC